MDSLEIPFADASELCIAARPSREHGAAPRRRRFRRRLYEDAASALSALCWPLLHVDCLVEAESRNDRNGELVQRSWRGMGHEQVAARMAVSMSAWRSASGRVPCVQAPTRAKQAVSRREGNDETEDRRT
jgi:hypothetical protein